MIPERPTGRTPFPCGTPTVLPSLAEVPQAALQQCLRAAVRRRTTVSTEPEHSESGRLCLALLAELDRRSRAPGRG